MDKHFSLRISLLYSTHTHLCSQNHKHQFPFFFHLSLQLSYFFLFWLLCEANINDRMSQQIVASWWKIVVQHLKISISIVPKTYKYIYSQKYLVCKYIKYLWNMPEMKEKFIITCISIISYFSLFFKRNISLIFCNSFGSFLSQWKPKPREFSFVFKRFFLFVKKIPQC